MHLSTSILRSLSIRRPLPTALAIVSALATIGAVAAYFLTNRENNIGHNLPASEASKSTDKQPEKMANEASGYSRHNWQSSGIVVQQISLQPFSQSIRLTGRVSLNEDQISHIFPMVEGSVDQVKVGLGQVVEANEILVIVHSRVVGQAKLELYQARLAHETSVVKDQLQREVADNTRQLLNSLRDVKPIIEIEKDFRNRSMGEFRERLLLAYSNYLKSDADLKRFESIGSDGAISGRQLHLARATCDADQATFQAKIEQVEFELRTALLLSSQAVKEAATRVAVAETNLRILGCEEGDIAAVDPVSQGRAISDYSIRAPLAGTIISKDVTLREQIRPDAQILSIADLSTVWISADIYERDVPLLSTLSGKPVQVHNEAWPDRTFEAKVFYTGEIMDESTRTIAMRAVAENKDHLLKPGMFVTIQLSGMASEQAVLQVPSAAILEHQGSQFVFVHREGDQFVRCDVKLGQANDTHTIVVNGLLAGDSVVVEGGFVLKSQMLAELMGEE